MRSLKTEINPSDNYRSDIIRILAKFIIFCRHHRHHLSKKPLKQLSREDVLTFLDSFRKPEASDPLHRWIGTYNLYRMHLLRFFKGLYSPDIESDKRPKPPIVENIPRLRRKEESIYELTDLWISEDDFIILEILSIKANEMFSYYGKRYQL